MGIRIFHSNRRNGPGFEESDLEKNPLLIVLYNQINKKFNLLLWKAISTWLNLVTLPNLNQVEMSHVILIININAFGLPEKKKSSLYL